MSELSEKLPTIEGLTLTSVHIGLTTWGMRGEDNNHPILCDEWRITIEYNEREYTTTYRTGIGHRKLNRFVKKERGGYATLSEYCRTDEEACKRGWLKVVPPELADVLSCLLSDAMAGEDTFYDFCMNGMGEEDSRASLETYLACQKTLIGLRHVLGHELLNSLRQLEH